VREQTQSTVDKHARREPRFVVNDLARVTVVGDEQRQGLHGRVCDVSKSGLALLMDLSIPEGSRVTVELDDTLVLASVRYCYAAAGQFRVGVSINDVEFEERAAATHAEAHHAPDSLWNHLKKLYKALTTGV
jgi:hypothetical protein